MYFFIVYCFVHHVKDVCIDYSKDTSIRSLAMIVLLSPRKLCVDIIEKI